jgi:cell volume regulation protein A
MFLVDQLILFGGILLLIGIVSSKVSTRLGLPVLVLFLAIGMLAGEDGIGGVHFDNFVLAHGIGTFALGIILFDGGLQTKLPALRSVWKPSALLATMGVLVTAIVTGVAAWQILDISLFTGLLLGSIVGSTDAAAVFSVLRSRGLNLRQRISATLEVESASNDPMAVFLTVGLLQVLTGEMEFGIGLVTLFVQQMGIGAVIGLGCGWLTVSIINRINLAALGLYPVLAGACGMLAFGTAASLEGSGFLAVYLAGVVLGNSRIAFQRGVFFFMDGMAWTGQIVMFVMLGLLSTPTELIGVAGPALAVAAVLILVARPLAVVPLLLPFGYSLREHVLISWVGLKGSVPIILAMFPLMYGLPEGMLLFDVVFFVVLVSATLQGWTLPVLASRLRLQDEKPAPPQVSLELVSLSNVNAEIIDYTISEGSGLAGQTVRHLQLPEGSLVALISRDHTLIAPRGSTALRAGDHLFVIAPPAIRAEVDRAFSG